jgi:hypothetical protein
VKGSLPWRRIAGVLLVAATVWYLTATIQQQWAYLRNFEWRADFPLLVASVLAHAVLLTGGVWIWSRVLLHFEHPPVRVRTMQRIWFLSNLARYVPGKVFQFIAVAQLSRSVGLSGAVLLTSMLVHTGFSLLSAIVVASWTVAGGIFRGVHPAWPALAVTVGAAFAVHPAFLNRLLAAIPRLLKRDVIRWKGRWRDGAALLTLSAASWFGYGAAYHLFIASLIDVPWSLMPALTGVNALSFVFGYVSPLPGGAGLREVSMKMLLEPYMASGVAAVLAIAARLWTIAAELLGGGAAVLLARGSLPPAQADAVGQ